MKNVTVIKLSRPLLLVTGENQEGYIYKVIYGCVVPENLGVMAYYRVHDYVGYLAGLHCWANGYKLFNITFEPRGVPDWMDKKSGEVHMKQDSWMMRIGEKCLKKLDLSYEVSYGSIDDETHSKYVEESDLIVSEEFFNEVKKPIEDEDPCDCESPLWEELPL